MTTTAEVIPLAPRRPLLHEMTAAYEQATGETGHERSFYLGLGLGYLIGFGLHPRSPLDTARLTPRSSNTHVTFRQPRPFDDEQTLWACGVRHGYALATSERADADECALCGERITEDDDYEQCFDGTFCGLDDCKATWHANGPVACYPDGDDE